jgi:hypothetical protein
MSIFSDMIRDMVKEEIAAAIKEQTTPEPTVTPPATTPTEPTVTATDGVAPEPTVTPPATPEPFNVEQFRGEMRKELSAFMKDALNGEVATVDKVDPDEALRSILGFEE